ALARCLREPHPELQVLALRALARLGAKGVSRLVVPLILGDGVLRDHALTVVTAIGPSAAPQLAELYGQADSQGKRAVVTALAGIGRKEALQFLLTQLPREPFDLQKHLVSSLCDAIDCTAPAQQVAIYPSVLRLLQGKNAALLDVRIAAMNILGHFRGPALVTKARKVLMKHAEAKNPPEVRRYALVSLNRLFRETKVDAAYRKFMRRMLCDPDWQDVAQYALRSFRRIDLGGNSTPYLVDLLRDSPHGEVHAHLFERLEVQDRPEITVAIIPFLGDPQPEVRERAEQALRRLPSSIDNLFRELMTSDDPEVCQRINSVLRDYPLEVRRKYVDRAANAVIKLFEGTDDRYLNFLEFVRGIDSDALRNRIYDKARSLKSGRFRTKWGKISAYLEVLWDHHLITPEGRYLLAVARLHLDPKDLSPDARRGSLGLQVIRALIYDDPEGLLRTLKRDRDVTAEDYFYLGFHFSEESEQTRPFGVDLLEYVVKKYPRNSLRGPALHKLETNRVLEARVPKKGTGRGAGRATRAVVRAHAEPAASRSRLTVRAGVSAAAARATRRKPRQDSASTAASVPGNAGQSAEGSAAKKAARSASRKKGKAQAGSARKGKAGARSRAKAARSAKAKPRPKKPGSSRPPRKSSSRGTSKKGKPASGGSRPQAAKKTKPSPRRAAAPKRRKR
ncbi:MAG: hypothetical protein O7J95_04175, partial [Planctomycetota bacterium]|nr:hypothetical protein [Planctomycetota bacterium]